jgi:acyl phosphate:glycerol-3-phosphate acyltransferase
MPFLSTSWLSALTALTIGYLLGSIPFGLLFSLAFGEGDVRKIGSGSIGATNVLRTGNRGAAALTLFFDAMKGAAAVSFVRLFMDQDAALFAALGAFLGHLYPIWLRFKGGKGVAVSLGILLSLFWPAGLLAFATWLAVVAVYRISSLAALVAAAMTPVYLLLFWRVHEAVLALVLAMLVFVVHSANIRRLLRGEEPRIDLNRKSA